MTTKEKLQAEMEHLSEADMDQLLRVVQEMQAKTDAAPPKKPGLMSKLMQIKIEAPEDFAANLDDYLYGGKKIGGDPDVR